VATAEEASRLTPLASGRCIVALAVAVLVSTTLNSCARPSGRHCVKSRSLLFCLAALVLFTRSKIM
jgi:hypothetical protein